MNSLACRHVQSPIALIAQPDAVTLDLPTDSGEAAIRFLHARLAVLPAVKNSDIFLSDLLERAAMASVCIASDVALPHARTVAVARTVLAVGRSMGPIAFDGEHPAVRLVFLIGTPKEGCREC
jgi:fructose PTS system EIIA component